MRLLIVDDHPLLRVGLARLFAIEFDATVIEAADAAEGLRRFREVSPEVTILDLNLPGEGGLSLLQTMRADLCNARIVVLSMRNDAWSAEAALRLGAIGYLSKSAPPDMILEAVRAALRGERFLEPAIAEALEAAGRRPGDDPFRSLSVPELDLLRRLLDGQRPDEIARGLGITDKTFANRKSMLRAKLGAETDLDLVKSARAAGFLGE